MIGIYKITSPTGRVYIGQSININRRRLMYVGNHCKKQAKLYASLCKYGFDNHLFEVIEICDECKLNEREEFYIAHFNTFNTPNGLNLSSGGLNKRVSEETKIKISKGNSGRVRPDLSERNKSNIGRKASESQREKMKNIQTGKKHSPETILKMKESARLRAPRSEETRLKMSESAKKKIISDDHKSKLMAWAKSPKNLAKKVINSDTGVIYESAKQAALENSYKYDTFKSMLNGNRVNNSSFRYL